jgi:hypothetical protein
MMDDGTPLGFLFGRLEEENLFIDSTHQKGTVSSHQWHVQLRGKSKHNDNAYSYWPGEGSTFYDAFRQALGNAGAITMRKEDEPAAEPKKRRSKADLLA